jgi:hypothetical protein
MKFNNVRIPKSLSMTVTCPECSAEPGERCFLLRERKDGRIYRSNVHEERVFAFAESVKPGCTMNYIRNNL